MAQLSQYIPRLAAGAFILSSGLDKRDADADTAAYLHSTAAAVYPFLNDVEPAEFAKAVSTGEIALGAALVTPFVPSGLVGLALGAFSGSLVGIYLKTPGLTRDDGVRPTPQGMGMAKDVFLLGIAGGLVAGALRRKR